MPIIVTPDTHIPIPKNLSTDKPKSFREHATGYFNAVKQLSDAGMDFEVNDFDKEESHKIVSTETFTNPKTIRAGTIANLEAILSSCDQELMDVSRRLRHFVTNKLIQETTDEDPKVRLKSLELLGKISEVGLFSEKKEITITTRTQADINTELEKTLELYLGRKAFEVPLEAEFEMVPDDVEFVNVDRSPDEFDEFNGSEVENDSAN